MDIKDIQIELCALQMKYLIICKECKDLYGISDEQDCEGCNTKMFINDIRELVDKIKKSHLIE